jgi:hypothetical protein
MKNRLPLLVLGFVVLLARPGSVNADVLSGPITNPGNGHSYFLLAPTNWTAMEAEAVSLGGHLATIRNATENEWVWTTFTALDGNSNLFIGFTDHAHEGTFTWASGEPVSYTNWRAGEPNNVGGEDFALMREADGQWNDVSGLFQYGVAEVVPEPSGIILFVAAGFVAVRARRRRSQLPNVQGPRGAFYRSR